MIIHWAPNPLCTVVELTAEETGTMRLRVHIDLLEERMVSAGFEIERKDFEEALKELDIETAEAEIDRRMRFLLESLKGDHFGDCVKQACSCMKCRAEEHHCPTYDHPWYVGCDDNGEGESFLDPREGVIHWGTETDRVCGATKGQASPDIWLVTCDVCDPPWPEPDCCCAEHEQPCCPYHTDPEVLATLATYLTEYDDDSDKRGRT